MSHHSAGDEPVTRGRHRDDERAADDQHPPAESVADPARERPQHDRTERERTDRDTDRDLAEPELVLDVVRDDRREHREREEVARPHVTTSTNCVVSSDRASRPGSFTRRASSSAASHDARSAISCRYCMTWRGRLNPSAPTMRSSRPNSATNCRSSSVPCATCTSASPATRPTRLDLAVVLIRPDERHRRERRRLAASPASSRLRRVHALLGRVGPVLEPHRARRRTAGSASARRRRPRRRRARRGTVSSHTHAVVEREARAVRAIGSRARRRRRRRRHRRRASCRRRAGCVSTRLVAVDALHVRVRAQVDAVVAVHGGDHVAERGPEAAHHRVRQRSRGPSRRGRASRHVAATSAPMKPAPITTTFGPCVEPRAERQRVVERPQREHARRGPGCVREPARRRARRERPGRRTRRASPSSSVDARGRATSSARRAARRAASRASRSSTPCLRSTMSSGSRFPASSSFESGGRS